MRRALQLAANGRGTTSPNPMVGAVIVDPDGNIIGEGWHRKFGGPHAEVNAVRSVANRSLLPESTIYVTLEPCSHYGKTPPCADLLVECGFRRVVVGSTDPNEKVSGRGIRRLTDAGIEVRVGVLEQECRELNKKFMTAHSLQRPYVLLKWACSKDMFLDCQRHSGEPAPRFSTPLTSLLVHRLRSEYDAIMVGSSTAINDNPRLDTRLYPGRSPRKAVIDGQGRLTPELNIFHTPGTLIITSTPDHPAKEKAEIITSADSHNIRQILSELSQRGISSVMVEGGATLLQAFIDSGLWDEARIEIAPLLLGNSGRTPMHIPEGVTSSTEIDRNVIINVKNRQIE